MKKNIIYQAIMCLFSSFCLFGSLHAYDLQKQVTEFSLPNGMRWLLVRRMQAPVFSGIVMVKVGGADEVKGKTGLAHMFEHMAFKGSSRIGTKNFQKEKPILAEIEKVGDQLTLEQKNNPSNTAQIGELSKQLAQLQKQADQYQVKNEIWELISRNGGSDLNAYTSKDATAYHASMPINRLELWARITADMIFDPTYREFYTERNVIAEERRSSLDNNPDGTMAEKLLNLSFESGPYHWSTIGFAEDIQGLTIKDARQFHEKYYVPQNMVGVLVGALDIAKAKALISTIFGKYSKKPAPAKLPQQQQTRGNVTESIKFDAEPSFAIAFHKPTLPDPSEYTFDVIEALLCSGRSSRFQKVLVYEKKMAQEIYCSDAYPGSRLNNMFLIWVDPLKSNKIEGVYKEVLAQLEKLKTEPVGEDELSRVRKNVSSSLVFALESNMQLAEQLARFQTIFDDWHILANYPQKIDEIDAKKVMDIATKYFTDSNRVVVERLKVH